MTELGWAMHAASLVEVVLDPETDEDQGEDTTGRGGQLCAASGHQGLRHPPKVAG